MRTNRSEHRHHRTTRNRLAGIVAAATITSSFLLAGGSGAGALTSPTLVSSKVTNYGAVLANRTNHTLYLLSTEVGGKVHCIKTCLTTWIPVLVRSTTKTITLGANVKGKIGFVARSSTTKQVTFNSYPVYTFVGDGGPSKSLGEAVVADGGTWLMLHAIAGLPATTPILPLLQKGNAGSYSSVLANAKGRSLYLLSNEVGASLNCTGPCLSIWIPLIVSSTTTSLAVGAGVKGTVGFVARSATTSQVTINSYPVYTYTGDFGAGQSYGEGIASYGGTWYLLSAAATTPSTTPVLPVVGGGAVSYPRV